MRMGVDFSGDMEVLVCGEVFGSGVEIFSCMDSSAENEDDEPDARAGLRENWPESWAVRPMDDSQLRAS